jgi:hypothetical protein
MQVRLKALREEVQGRPDHVWMVQRGGTWVKCSEALTAFLNDKFKVLRHLSVI